jgi:hypothetical protein
LHRFVTRSADLEEDPILAFERDLAIVQTPRRMHQTKRANELLAIESRQTAGRAGLPGFR